MTCPISWPTYGVFTGGADGSDVNAVDRAPDSSFLLSSDDSGKVNLVSYPAVEGKTPAKKSFSGHSSHVTNVKVCNGGGYAVSTGGADLSVFVWEIKKSQ
jgi:microtubule-associated protein-like 1/2